ncbi:ankyrin repeat domain-containing protein [Intestinibacter sp.]
MAKIAIGDMEEIPCLSRKTINTLVNELDIPVELEKRGKQNIAIIDEKDLDNIIVYMFTKSLTKLVNNGADISKRKDVTSEIKEKSCLIFMRELEEHLAWHMEKLKELTKVIGSNDSGKYLEVLDALAENTGGVPQENVIILDTSVFHKKPAILDELVGKFSRIIIPEVVITELNYQKDGKNKKIDKRKVSLILGSINKYKDRLILSDKVDCSTARNNDDLIIEVAKRETSENVYILTEDVDFDIKCENIPNVTVLSLKGYELKFNAVDRKIDYKKTMEFINGVKQRNYDFVKKMNLDNVDVNNCGDNGQTALIRAVRNRDIKMINILINNCKVDLNTLDKNKYRMPALTHAVMINNFKIVELLIKKGADINLGSCGNNRGNTPLMVASWNGNLKIVEILLKQKEICINQQDSNGYTPLIKAAIRNKDKIVEVLLKNKADKYVRSKEGMTALDYATKNMKEHSKESQYAKKIVELLK